MSKETSTLPPGWAEANVGDLVGYDGLFCDGDWVESKDQDPAGDVRLIQLADVGDGDYRDRSNRFLTSAKAAELRCTYIQPHDLLVARMPDPLGRACIFPGDPKPSITVVDVCIIRLGSPVHSRWLMHQLNTPQMKQLVAALQSGSTRKRISRANFAKIRFPLPPLPEQTRIADALDEVLSDLDAGDAALERVRDKLKLYRTSVLKDAVDGNLTAEWRKQHPQVEPASELLKRILAERRRHWEQEQLRKFKATDQEPPKNWKAKYEEPVTPDTANLGALPEGWCWANTGQVCDFITKGTTPPGKDAPQPVGEVPFVKVQHLSGTGGFWFSASPSFVSRATHEGFLSRSKAFPGDVLMNIVGPPLGQVSIIPRDFPEWNVNQAIAIFRPLTGLSRRFLANSLVAKTVLERALRRTKTTAGQVNLTLEVCRDLPIPLPPFGEQEAIVEAAEDQLSIIDHLEADLESKLKSTQALRQAILRHAFAGKLVPQDASDEPASELLTRIAAERERRAREAAAAKRLNGRQPRHVSRARTRGKAGATDKETHNGCIADR